MGGLNSPLNDDEFLREVHAISRLTPLKMIDEGECVQRLYKLVERNQDFHVVNSARALDDADMGFINGLVKEVDEWNTGLSSRGWIISKVYALFAEHMYKKTSRG